MTKTSKTRYAGVYKDERGSFFYQCFLGRDPETGKKVTKKGRKASNGKPFKNAHEAYIELTRIRNEYLEENGKANYRMTYGIFLKKKFIPKYKADVEQNTFESRNSAFSIMYKRFGSKRLEDITAVDCDEFRTWLLTENNYSKGYAALVYIAFRQSMRYATRMGYIRKNVSLMTKAVPKSKAVVPYWTKSQFERVVSQCYLESYDQFLAFILIWTYFMTGIRVSEGLALQWDDIDFENSKLRIHHNLVMKNKHDYKIKPYTKTSNGMRTISLDATTLSYLSQWRTAQHSRIKSQFIFSYDGLPLHRSSIRNIIARYAKMAGVPVIQAKGLRHSHVSYLINEFNADVLTVSRRLGHSSPDITLKYYAHLWNRNDDTLTDQMTNNISFKPATENRVGFQGNQFVKMS